MNVGKKKYSIPKINRPRERNTKTTANTLGTPFLISFLFAGSIADAIVIDVNITRAISLKIAGKFLKISSSDKFRD